MATNFVCFRELKPLKMIVLCMFEWQGITYEGNERHFKSLNCYCKLNGFRLNFSLCQDTLIKRAYSLFTFNDKNPLGFLESE